MGRDASKYKVLIISEIYEEIKGFKRLVFKHSPEVTYRAGQYLTLVHLAGNEEIRRSYSITSSPEWKEPLSIGVKRIENGFFSRLLVDNAEPGDQLLTIGAGGIFTLPEDMSDICQIIFFAAGSGITPVFSLIKTVLYTHPTLKCILIYSNSSPEKTIFYNSLRQLEEDYADRFSIEFIFSNIPNLSRAHLYRELLVEFLEKYATHSLNQILFYICGPEAYMRMCTYVLQEEKVPKGNIRKENFIIQKLPAIRPIPPDTEEHQATVVLGGDTYHFPVQYPDSILIAARKQGIQLPYSCETGRCGNCVAKCTKGKVWLSYNEVLTDRDLAKGLTLTCVGHPIGGDIELSI